MKILMASIITGLLVLTEFNGQENNSLVGKWECYHKELEDGTTKSTDPFSGEEFEYSCDGYMIELKSDYTGYESYGGYTFKYSRKDTMLILGNREYVIEKLTQEELVIRSYSSSGFNNSNFREKFRKLK